MGFIPKNSKDVSVEMNANYKMGVHATLNDFCASIKENPNNFLWSGFLAGTGNKRGLIGYSSLKGIEKLEVYSRSIGG